jgi:glycosyltransferase involved in cell wall biosynthesis
MEETAIEQACYLMDYPVDSNVLYTFNKENHVAHFVEMVVKAYNDDYLWQQKANAALQVREVCGWDKVALQWRQHLFQKTKRYLPAEDYRKVQRINHRTHEIFSKRWSNPEEWAYYPEKEKHLEVVVPFYNASQYLRKCIESIAAQNYENFRLHLIDDASEDDSHAVAADAVREFGLSHCTVQYKTNETRVGALANQVWAMGFFGMDSIVVLIDGDDALSNDPNVFKKVNAEYHTGADMTYGSMWSLIDDIPLIAQEYPREVFEEKSFRSYRFPWKIPYTHLRTFSMEAFDRVHDDLLRDHNGDYYKAAGDSALFYALLDVCDHGAVRPIRDVLYIYNDLNPLNDYKVNSPEQIKNSEEIAPESRFVWNTTKGLTIDNSKRVGEPFKFDSVHSDSTGLKRILIAIPTSLNIHPETFKSIYDLETPKNCTVDFQFFYGYCIDQVRNLIAHYTISNHYDYLFSVDYDMEFAPDTLVKLLNDQCDIVSGLYIQRKPGEHILEIYRKDDLGCDYNVPLDELEGQELVPVNGCGFGCVLIKTEVLKEIGYPQFTYHHAIRIEDTISEDVDFCNKAQKKGFEIYANTTVRCRHHGKTAFEV